VIEQVNSQGLEGNEEEVALTVFKGIMQIEGKLSLTDQL